MLTVCVTSDLHGRADRLAAYQQEMARVRPDIIVDNGDFWQGSLSSFYYDYVANKPNPMFDLANAIRFDALVFGNHEFNETPLRMQKRQAQCQFPWISCNLGDFATPYIIKKVKGKRVGIIGATTQLTPLWDEMAFTKGVVFEPAAPAVARYVRHLREVECVDYVIVSYHGGFSEHISGMWPFQANPLENEANALLAIDGIDVLVTGHQHLEVCTKVGETVVVQPGANGDCYAKIVLAEVCSAELVRLEGEPFYEAEVVDWLRLQVGVAQDDFRFQGLLVSRMGGNRFADLVHKVQLSYSGADLSIVDLLYYEAGGFVGPVTNADVLKVLSRPNVLQKVWLTGKEVRQFLEEIAATFEVNEAGVVDFSYNVKPESNPPYLYFYVGGLEYTLALSRPVGERVVACTFQGEPLCDTRQYSVCLNSYLATGADFPVFRNKAKLTISEEIIPLLVLAYIKEHSPLQHEPVSRFRVVKSVDGVCD